MAQLALDPTALDAAAVAFFAVLSSPIRLAVLRLLLDGERRVSDLVAALGIPQPRLSNHLACLRHCGFVTVRRRGPFLYYALADPRVGDLICLGSRLAEPTADALQSCNVLEGEREA